LLSLAAAVVVLPRQILAQAAAAEQVVFVLEPALA